MKNCGNYTEIYDNKSGSFGYCSGCSSFHLIIKGMLTVLNQNQLASVEKNLKQMKADLVENYNSDTIQAGVQIKLSNNIFLCLNFNEISESIELIEIGIYMHQIKEIIA